MQQDLEAFARSFQIRALLLGGRLEEAERRLQLAIGVVAAEKDEPHEDLFRYWLGQLYVLTGEMGRATAEAWQLAERPAQPSSLFALRAAAEIGAAARDGVAGRRAAALARAIAAEYPSRRAKGIAAQCEGLAMLGRGEGGAALARLEEAEALWGDVAIWWSLGEAARGLGRWREAAGYYRRVSEQFSACLRFECILNWIVAPAHAGSCLQKAGDSDAGKLQIDGFLRRWKLQTRVVLIRELAAL
jgi:tetratricopeptide (TPR) repeat protein